MTFEKKERGVKPPLECMVCGKLFPRGALDLARHQSALTLLHKVGDKKTASLQYGCRHCGLFFSTDEHLEIHSNQSSCGKKRAGFFLPEDECLICSAPNMVDGVPHDTLFPKHVYSTSKRLNVQHICPKCGLYFISEEIVAEHLTNSFCTRFEAQKERERERETGRGRDRRSFTSEVEESGSDLSQPKRLRLSREESNDSNTLPLSPFASTSTDQQTSLRRTKRIKQLIPAERKAFYAVCSLFVNKSKVRNESENVIITTDNLLSYIDDDKLPLIKRLMDVLNYDC